MGKIKTKLLRTSLPILLGIGCLFIPLLRNFHIESAIAAATVGCFWAGWVAAGRQGFAPNDRAPILSILGSVYLFGFVLFVHSLITGCFSFYGLGYWLLYPWPSVLFGYSIGRLLRIFDVPFRRLIVVIVLFAVAVGVWLFEFFHYPQVYFFNQVWGGWPGPIYDETLKPGGSLIAFRVLTLLWVGIFWFVWEIFSSRKAGIIVAGCVIFLVIGYILLPNLGIVSPTSYLQDQLGGVTETPHFIIYYDKKHYTEDEVGFIAQKEEFYYQQITQKLNLLQNRGSDKIQSYLYGNVWQKKELVGAKYTSYVPVWLRQDQLHIAKGQIPGSLKHELVHVLAKQFGNKLLNASWSIGLVEGLAVALAGNQSPISTINEIVRSEKPYPTARQMKHAFSFWGFYGGRAAVNYIQSGSFVRYLLDNYPVKEFKQAYRTGNMVKAYHEPFKKLVKGWHQVLDTVSVDSKDKKMAKVLYSVPSLFEQECPHVQTHAAYLQDRFRYFMMIKDTSKALSYLGQLRKLLLQKNLTDRVNTIWVYFQLKAGHAQKVLKIADSTNQSAGTLLLYADAFAMDAKMKIAGRYVSKAAQILSKHPDSILKHALSTRQNPEIWKYYRDIVYYQQAVSDSIFKTLDGHTRIQALNQAISHYHWKRLKRYARIITGDTLSASFFSTYNQTIQWLAYLGDRSEAVQLLDELSKLPLRKRYRQRLTETRKWVYFEKKQSIHKK